LQRAVILEMASEEITDGLMQWPQTRRLIARRLGPTAVLLDEEQIEPLREQMRELGFAGE
jgi:hypothetical protein